MGFPDKILYDPPPGFTGEAATVQPVTLVATSGAGFRAGPGGIGVGRFVWRADTGAAGQVSSWDGQIVSHTPVGKEAPTGLAMRRQDGLLRRSGEDWRIPEGQNVTLARAGDLFAVSDTEAHAGQAVYAKTGTGAITTVKDTKAPSDAILTSFVVTQGGAAGEIIVISATGESTQGGATS